MRLNAARTPTFSHAPAGRTALSLVTREHDPVLAPELMDRARVPLERMLEMAGRTVGQGDVGKPVLRPGEDSHIDAEDIDPRISGD